MGKLEKYSKEELIEKINALSNEIQKYKKSAAVNETLLRISELSHRDSSDIYAFYTEVCRELNAVIDTSNFYIARLKNQGAQLSFDFYQDTYGMQFEHAHDFPIRPYGNGLTELVIDSGKTVLLEYNDIAEKIKDGTISHRRNCAYSWLGAPLIYDSKKLGAIVVQSYRPDYQFDEDDKSVFNFVSQHIASSIFRYENKQKLEYSARTDPLTGLLNRATFMDRLSHLKRSQTKLQHACLLFIDLDGFKIINDSYGHDVGDQLLIRVAELITAELRDVDEVGRFGGDEFVVLINRLRHKEDAVAAAQRLIDSLSKPISLLGKAMSIGASIGIAYGNNQLRDENQLLKEADEAMYRAKRAGKSQYFIANEGY